MLFGIDNNYRKWVVLYDKNDPRTLQEIIEVAQNDVKGWVYAHAKCTQDAEDILSEIAYRLLKYLGRYFENSRDKTVAERNAYLMRMARCTLIDYYRRENHGAKGGNNEQSLLVIIDDLDMLDAMLPKSELERGNEAETRLINLERLREAVIAVLNLNSKPEKVLCLILCAFLAEDYAGSAKNYMSWLCETLNDNTLYDLLATVKRLLNSLNVGDEAYAVVERKLAVMHNGKRYGDQTLRATVRDLTVWVSSARDNLRKKLDEEQANKKNDEPDDNPDKKTRKE